MVSFAPSGALAKLPLIHDDSLNNRARVPTWTDWFKAAGIDEIDVSRGLRFNSADHTLDAVSEGAGALLAHDVLAYDDLRTGHLVVPVPLVLPSGRAYHFLCPRRRTDAPQVRAFGDWVKQEMAGLDWTKVRGLK